MTEAEKELQQNHASKIRSERTIMDMTGLSRGQLRLMERFQDRVQTEHRERLSTTVEGKPRVMQTGEQNFYPKPIAEVVRGGDAAGGEAPLIDIIDDEVIFSFSGTLYYCTVNGSVGDPV